MAEFVGASILFLVVISAEMGYNTDMQRRTFRTDKQKGFTIVELLTTIAILAMFYGLVITNFNQWRGPQAVRLAASEVATQLNKVRAYALSARNNQGSPVKLYLLEFCTEVGNVLCNSKPGSPATGPEQYRLHFIGSDASGADSFVDSRDLEVFKLPGTGKISELTYTNSMGVSQTTKCLQVAYSLPYGRVYIDPLCRLDDNNTDPQSTGYNPFNSLPALDALANARAGIVISWDRGSQKKIVSMDGVSGRVSNFDALECDVWPKGSGDGRVSTEDYNLLGQMSVGAVVPLPGVEFQKADCAPAASGGDGVVNAVDLTQAGNYANATAPTIPSASGPTSN